MFASVGWGEILVLVVAALVILGPERLPGAITWVTDSLRKAREFASGASSQLKQELGPDFEELRGPIQEIGKLRGMNPRTAITKHLLDGDDSLFGGSSTNGTSPANPAPENPRPASPPAIRPLPTDGPPRFDPDAT